MTDLPPYRLCKLYHFDHNVKKTWLLEFYQWNVVSQKLERRFFSKFNKPKTVKDRLKEAGKWERFINKQLESGAVYNPNFKIEKPIVVKIPLLLDDLAAYLREKESILGDNSYKVYRNFGSKLTAFIKISKLEKLLTKDLTNEICEQYRNYILNLHSHPITRNKEITQFKIFCNYYTKKGHRRFDASPALDVDLVPAGESELHEPYTDEQAIKIIELIKQKQDWSLLLFIYFIYYCFARPGREVRLMKIGDLRDKSVIIKSKYSKTGITKTPTLTKSLLELIDFLNLTSYPANYYIFGKGGVPGLEPVNKNYFYYYHKKILNELGIVGKYTVYGWKHTGNIKAIRLGIHPKKLQLQNGFIGYKTMEIYTRRLAAFSDDEIYNNFI